MKNGYSPTLCKSLLALALLSGMLASPPVYAQNNLRVLDPQQPWRNFQGTIEEAVLSVRPKGVYMEVGMYLTFSARGSGFSNFDSLEVELFFTLPDEAVVTDSWLWVEDVIIRAEIRDTWTARDIYENVVRRRRDPSVLYKRGAGRYELRVFPMAANETRRVKITYQIPALWTAQAVSVPLTTALLQTSWNPIPRVSVLAWPDATWRNPKLVEEPHLAFVERSNALGAYRQADLPASALGGPLTLALDSPLQNGIFLSRIAEGDDTWYQLALLPAHVLDLSARRNVALLFDYDAAKTNLTQAEVLSTARSLLQTSLTPADSFNLIVSQLDIRRASETWLPATPAAIEAAFAALGPTPLADYSNLPALMADGIAFVNEQGPGGSLLLLSSADQVGEAAVADRLIEDLRASARRLPPIHVVDYTNRNFSSYFFAGQRFEGNGYFYATLSRLTGGTYLNVRDGHATFSDALATSFSALGGTISAFDLFTTLRFGFCFNRFTSNDGGEVVFINRAILQVGRCLGGFPFEMEAAGVFNATPFSQTFRISEQNTRTSDTTLVAHWTGRQILALEREPQTNDVVNQILDLSLDQRVLSLYTAFLALDPERGGEPCTECQDETDPTLSATEDEAPLPDQVVLTAYPNPFHTTVTIAVTLPEPVDLAEVTFQVYDVMGRVVKTLRPDAAGLAHTFTLTWDGTNDAGQPVTSGTYFFVMVTPTGRHTITLTLVR